VKKKKLIIIFTFLLVFAEQANAQWQWVTQIGGPSNEGTILSVDQSGNSYAFGVYAQSCTFPSGNIFDLGYNDLFLVKYNASGNELWHKGFGGNNNANQLERGGDIKLDEVNGAIYITGVFYGTMIIDQDTVTSTTLDVFLAKLDTSGNCQWIIKATAFAVDDFAGRLCLDSNGNVYWSATILGPGTLGSYSLSAGTFLAKVDPNGNVLSARNEFYRGYPTGMQYLNNELYFSGIAESDTLTVDTITIVSHATDPFVFKSDTLGGVVWVKRFGSAKSDYATSIAVSSLGVIYVCGNYNDTLIFETDTLLSLSVRDAFLARLNHDGSLKWIRQTNCNGVSGAYSGSRLDIYNDDVYWIGSFSGSAIFGAYTPTSLNTTDMFISRYDTAGNCIGIRNFGYALGNSVQVKNGSLYVSGPFYNTVTIGTNNLTSTGGSADIYIAKSDLINGMEDPQRTQNLKQLIIYANPNNGTFTVKVPEEVKTLSGAVLIIFDNTGKETARFALDNTSETPNFDIRNSSSGMYTVQLLQGDKRYVGKLVVE
jgi:Secretion system C-terminal sorting domain